MRDNVYAAGTFSLETVSIDSKTVATKKGECVGYDDHNTKIHIGCGQQGGFTAARGDQRWKWE